MKPSTTSITKNPNPSKTTHLRPRYYHGIGVFFCPECFDRNLHCHLFYPVKYLRVRDASDLQPSAQSLRLDSESSVPTDATCWIPACCPCQSWVVCRLCVRVDIHITTDGSSRPPPTSLGVPTITTTPNRLSITEIKKKSFGRRSCRIDHADWCVIAENTDFCGLTTVFASFKQQIQPLAPRVPKMYIVTQWGLLCCWCYSQYRDV